MKFQENLLLRLAVGKKKLEIQWCPAQTLLDKLTSFGLSESATAIHTPQYTRTPHAVKISLQNRSACQS